MEVKAKKSKRSKSQTSRQEVKTEKVEDINIIMEVRAKKSKRSKSQTSIQEVKTEKVEVPEVKNPETTTEPQIEGPSATASVAEHTPKVKEGRIIIRNLPFDLKEIHL
jgi:hypothetical protein